MAEEKNEKNEDLIKLLESEHTEPPLVVQPKPLIEPQVQPNDIEMSKPKNEMMEPEPEADSLGLKKMVINFGIIADRIAGNYINDRSQIEEAIIYFQQQVRDKIKLNEKPSEALIEGWVKLLAVKAEVNSSATQLTDSVAKLLSAAKNNNIILNIGGSGDGKTGLDLDKLLGQPTKEDEQ